MDNMPTSDETQEPTINWLISQLCPESSPLIDFNKKRLVALIEADRHHHIALARLEECNFRYKFLLDTTKSKDFQKGFKAAFKQIDTVLDNRIAEIEKSMGSKE